MLRSLFLAATRWRRTRRRTGEGKLAERFIGLRLLPQQSAVTADAVRSRHTTLANHVQSVSVPALQEFAPRSLMAAPLVVFDEVIGAVTFLHDSEDEFFNEDLAAKATILAGQLGGLLEATRMVEVSREEHRRAEILTEVATALHGTPDVDAVVEAIADRLRLLLRTRLVSVLLRREDLSNCAPSRPKPRNSPLLFAPVTIVKPFASPPTWRNAPSPPGKPSPSPSAEIKHSLGSVISPGMLIAGSVPHFPHRGSDSCLSPPRRRFTAEERSLVSAIAGFGAVALAQCGTLFHRAGPGRELHQLLEFLPNSVPWISIIFCKPSSSAPLISSASDAASSRCWKTNNFTSATA